MSKNTSRSYNIGRFFREYNFTLAELTHSFELRGIPFMLYFEALDGYEDKAAELALEMS